MSFNSVKFKEIYTQFKEVVGGVKAHHSFLTFKGNFHYRFNNFYKRAFQSIEEVEILDINVGSKDYPRELAVGVKNGLPIMLGSVKRGNISDLVDFDEFLPRALVPSSHSIEDITLDSRVRRIMRFMECHINGMEISNTWRELNSLWNIYVRTSGMNRLDGFMVFPVSEYTYRIIPKGTMLTCFEVTYNKDGGQDVRYLKWNGTYTDASPSLLFSFKTSFKGRQKDLSNEVANTLVSQIRDKIERNSNTDVPQATYGEDVFLSLLSDQERFVQLSNYVNSEIKLESLKNLLDYRTNSTPTS